MQLTTSTTTETMGPKKSAVMADSNEVPSFRCRSSTELAGLGPRAQIKVKNDPPPPTKEKEKETENLDQPGRQHGGGGHGGLGPV